MKPIDCVITWVDGADATWRERKRQYSQSEVGTQMDDSIERYRDFGILRYLFRGIESFMPWVRDVYLITCGQIPDWININHPRLRLINHEDYIPKMYLPTFNSHTIEMNFHRIEGLSENFIYFNDDMFVLRDTTENDFFKKGLPCGSAVLNAFAIKRNPKGFDFLIPINDISVINRHFSKKKTLQKVWFKYFNPKYGIDAMRTICLSPWKHFTGFYDYHLPYSLTKEVLGKLWEVEPELLNETCLHKFRNSRDVNIWLALYWQYASGQFTPRSPKIGLHTHVTDNLEANERVYAHIKNQKSKLIVVNDDIYTLSSSDVKIVCERLNSSFNGILPNKSTFER